MALVVKNLPCQCRRCKRYEFDPFVGKIAWSRKWQTTPVFLPGKFHGQSNLEGYSPWGLRELDTTESTHTHTHMWWVSVVARGIFVASCGVFPGSTLQLWCTGSRARDSVVASMWDISSLTRDRTSVPCVARWILNHWTTREVPQ